MSSTVIQVVLDSARALAAADGLVVRFAPRFGPFPDPFEVHSGDVRRLTSAAADGAAAAFECRLPLEATLAEVSGVVALDVEVGDDLESLTFDLPVTDELMGWRTQIPRRDGEAPNHGVVNVSMTLLEDPAAIDLAERIDTALTSLVPALLIAWEAFLDKLCRLDPVTLLPGPSEFALHLGQVVEAKRRSDGALTVLLVSPDDFARANVEAGQDRADRALREMGQCLSDTVARLGSVFRFGGAAFAVVARCQSQAAGVALADALHTELGRCLPFAAVTDLTFSIGAAIDSSSDSSSSARELSLVAENALSRARALGGDRVICSNAGDDRELTDASNPLAGMFSTDSAKDYRNGQILWRTMALLAEHADGADLSNAFAELLLRSVDASRVMLLELIDGSVFELGPTEPARLTLSPAEENVVESAYAARQAQWQQLEGNLQCLVAPLVSHGRILGCLWLEGPLQFDATDQAFVQALANQFAGALDRAKLAELWLQRKENESSRLRQELMELRESTPVPAHRAVVGSSAAMRALFAEIEKVAPTEASILVLGESGAGKEVIARQIHDASLRRGRPFVIVDCGAIAETLIDSELFGRTRGAYTGADAASAGRIAEADGGTLFLDEIGELPLEVQTKLLRFVQEKEIIAVGATDRRRVDARIIAATNRDLHGEVLAGRFREDLYYRLQVVQLSVPPLRARREDMRALVTHFVSRFCAEFGKPELTITPAAWAKLEAYGWPGNVRELQNAVIRLVLRASGTAVEASDVRLGAELAADVPPPTVDVRERRDGSNDLGRRVGWPTGAGVERRPARPRPPAVDESPGQRHDVWERLQHELKSRIEETIDNEASVAPLGRWLIDDLVLNAELQADGNLRRAAAIVGMPETTFRRQLSKAKHDVASAYRSRSEAWNAMKPIMQELVKRAPERKPEAALIDRCKAVLLDEVASTVDADVRLGAMLMGISTPTYRRWLQTRQGSSQ